MIQPVGSRAFGGGETECGVRQVSHFGREHRRAGYEPSGPRSLCLARGQVRSKPLLSCMVKVKIRGSNECEASVDHPIPWGGASKSLGELS
jgi:hypothetical protein